MALEYACEYTGGGRGEVIYSAKFDVAVAQMFGFN